jgi:hypothetical protein
MGWDARATADAQSAIRALPPELSHCVQFDHGSIAPLGAPYTRCAIAGSPAPGVEYFATGATPGRGLYYLDGPPTDFSTGYSIRHLVGAWYAFAEQPSMPLGYSFPGL